MNGSDDPGVARAVSLNADEGFDGGLGDDLVIVLPHPRFLAGDVRSLQHRGEQRPVIGAFRRDKEWESG